MVVYCLEADRTRGPGRRNCTAFSTGRSHSFGGTYLGWQKSLALLVKLVEAEIPD
ncbi:MAG: hypothetical protein ACM3IK_16265 [Sphingomonadaceae bacterium]